MSFADIIRIVALVEIGVTIGLMLMVIVVASKVLKGAKGIGFLLWHILAISVGSSLLIAVAAEGVITRLGVEPLNWRSPVFLVGITIFNSALWIIYRVETARYTRNRKR